VRVSKTTVKRHPERGVYDRATIDPILDASADLPSRLRRRRPPVRDPTIHSRDGDTLYVHGSPGSRMLRTAKEAIDICVTVTLLDGLVLARSVYNHSMNYRSVVVLGRAREVTDPDEKLRAMHRVVDHVVPGRWEDARQPNDGENQRHDDPRPAARRGFLRNPAAAHDRRRSRQALPIWAGVIPLGIEPEIPCRTPASTDPRGLRSRLTTA